MRQSELAVREFFDLIQQAFDVAKTISLVFALIISTDYFWVLLMTTKPKANFLTAHSVLPVSHGLPEDLHYCFLFNLTSYLPRQPRGKSSQLLLTLQCWHKHLVLHEVLKQALALSTSLCNQKRKSLAAKWYMLVHGIILRMKAGFPTFTTKVLFNIFSHQQTSRS